MRNFLDVARAAVDGGRAGRVRPRPHPERALPPRGRLGRDRRSGRGARRARRRQRRPPVPARDRDAALARARLRRRDGGPRRAHQAVALPRDARGLPRRSPPRNGWRSTVATWISRSSTGATTSAAAPTCESSSRGTWASGAATRQPAAGRVVARHAGTRASARLRVASRRTARARRHRGARVAGRAAGGAGGDCARGCACRREMSSRTTAKRSSPRGRLRLRPLPHHQHAGALERTRAEVPQRVVRLVEPVPHDRRRHGHSSARARGTPRRRAG